MYYFQFFVDKLGNNLFKTEKLSRERWRDLMSIARHFLTVEEYSKKEYNIFAIAYDENGAQVEYIDNIQDYFLNA